MKLKKEASNLHTLLYIDKEECVNIDKSQKQSKDKAVY